MQYRHLYPMVRILLPFMIGIILCVVIDATVFISIFIWIGLLILSLITGFIHFTKKKFVKRTLFGIFLSSFLFVTGYNSVLLHKEILSPYHFSKISDKGVFVAVVSEPMQEKEHSFKSILTITGVKQGNKFIKAEGRILTYFEKDSVKTPPLEGSTIVFSGQVQPIGPPKNPGAFDYRKYMAISNVYHQVYLNKISWKTLETYKGFNVIIFAHQVSQKFVNILKSNGLKGQEFAVASALILGQCDMLDNETRQAYSGSGVTHILSVSGLHVGVIFIIINFLLGFMKKEGAQLYFKTLIILITIWAYALLTGMSPSVMRSAAMFTFISFGNASKRNVHIINSLSVSALVLLLFDPLMISNIGFQLSYIAILGIVLINKPIVDLYSPKNKIVNKIWGLIAVSIAAQLATAPLTIFYFHQFPSYFIPANLVAIPLSFLAIYSGVAVLFFSCIPAISNFLGFVTNCLLYALNFSVGFIEKLPHSVLIINSVFKPEMILLYLILISVILMFSLKQKKLIFVTLGLSILVSVNFSFTEIQRQNQQKIVFYSTNKQSSIGFVTGKQQVVVADSLLLKDKLASKFQLAGTASLLGISSTMGIALDTLVKSQKTLPEKFKPLFSVGNFMCFRNKRIVIIDNIPKLTIGDRRLEVDYLLIRYNAKLHIKDLQKVFEPKLVLFDGSNSNYKTTKWMAECQECRIKAYNLKDSGAFIVDLQVPEKSKTYSTSKTASK